MDASALRWTLAIIGTVLLVGIYLHGLHQNRLRQRIAMETLTREKSDSAFNEDETLRTELDNLSLTIAAADEHESYDDIHTNHPIETDLTPFKSPLSEWFVADIFAIVEPEQRVNHFLYHADYEMMTDEAIESVLALAGLVMNKAGYIECRHQGELAFMITSLSAPGHFMGIFTDDFEFYTRGFNCFINLQTNRDPAASYEIMLLKIDELVRLLDVEVYRFNHDLLTISDVTRIRSRLLD
jgi:FtsZ-interacting cell division protein ZipA